MFWRFFCHCFEADASAFASQSSTNARLTDLRAELATKQKALTDLQTKSATTLKEITALEAQQAQYEQVIAVEENAIFNEFCKRIKVKTIKEFEETQMGDVQSQEEVKLRFKTQIARLTNKCVVFSPLSRL